MPITSVVIETSAGANNDLLGRLAHLPRVNVYGIKGDQIVTVIEGESTAEIEETVRIIQGLETVVGVYPVYSGEYE